MEHEERGDDGFFRVYEIKAMDESRGTVELRAPGVKAAVDEIQTNRLARARDQGIEIEVTPEDRLRSAERWWLSDASEVDVSANTSIGAFGDPVREDRVRRVLWARLYEVRTNGGASLGWYGEPWSENAAKWYADAERRFEAADPEVKRDRG